MAAGLQLAVRVEVPFLRIDAGLAVSVQMGALEAMPAPLTVTLCGLPDASLVTVIAPNRVPTETGVNVTLMLQDAPAAKLGPQL